MEYIFDTSSFLFFRIRFNQQVDFANMLAFSSVYEKVVSFRTEKLKWRKTLLQILALYKAFDSLLLLGKFKNEAVLKLYFSLFI